MRCTPTLLNPTPWLSSLKASQLQKIAQATGIRSAGPKAPLIKRLETELAQCELPSHQLNPSKHLSILSIDMGIRNLAFAHLLVPSPSSSLVPQGTINSETRIPPAPTPTPTPSLNAWRRLAVSDLHDHDDPSSGSNLKLETQSSKDEDQDKETFHPPFYAHQAYTLITTLLAKYQPTHVLIERQRFRSGGGSAVQEWTLRVGVFEGMLYAVLYALGRERMRDCGSGSAAPVVLGVEPQRVARYWGEVLALEGGRVVKEKGKGRASSREGKKVKIDLVGAWLDCALGDAGRGDLKVAVGREGKGEEVRRLVDAYLGKWKGKKRARRVKGEDEGAGGDIDIGKLDDLADCLVQGVTWLNWHVMRDRILREGVHALGME